jgi:hypothetical protein
MGVRGGEGMKKRKEKEEEEEGEKSMPNTIFVFNYFILFIHHLPTLPTDRPNYTHFGDQSQGERQQPSLIHPSIHAACSMQPFQCHIRAKKAHSPLR